MKKTIDTKADERVMVRAGYWRYAESAADEPRRLRFRKGELATRRSRPGRPASLASATSCSLGGITRRGRSRQDTRPSTAATSLVDPPRSAR